MQIFDRSLSEVVFVKKFPAYVRRQAGIVEKIGTVFREANGSLSKMLEPH